MLRSVFPQSALETAWQWSEAIQTNVQADTPNRQQDFSRVFTRSARDKTDRGAEEVVEGGHHALWEVINEVARLNLLCEDIRLVQEENDGRVCKELVVADALK